MSQKYNNNKNNHNPLEGSDSDTDMDIEADFNWDEVDPNDPITDFIDRIETTGSQAFDNIPADLFEHPGVVSLVWNMGYGDDILNHCPESLKNDDTFRNSLVSYSKISKERFFEMLEDEEEGYLAFYQVHPDLLSQKDWMDTLCEMGYQTSMLEHYPPSIKSTPEFEQQMSHYQAVFKTVSVTALFHKHETPDNGDENVWGQRESYEHYRAILKIDEKTFLFDKHVSFSPLHDTDEVVMRVSFYLNEHEIANSTLCIDEEKNILNDEAFLLLRRFKLTEATVPKIESYQINLFQKDWDNLFALEANNARKVKNI
jgi:hypothetical protein